MVAKMPAKSTATSTMGAQLKWLDARGPAGPSVSETTARMTRITSRTNGKWMASPALARGPEKSTVDYHQDEQEDVDAALEPHGHVVGLVHAPGRGRLLAVVVELERQIDRQHQADDQQPLAATGGASRRRALRAGSPGTGAGRPAGSAGRRCC